MVCFRRVLLKVFKVLDFLEIMLRVVSHEDPEVSITFTCEATSRNVDIEPLSFVFADIRRGPFLLGQL